jgi:hypothetical protein
MASNSPIETISPSEIEMLRRLVLLPQASSNMLLGGWNGDLALRSGVIQQPCFG